MPVHSITGGGGLRLHVEDSGNPNGRPLLFITYIRQCALAAEQPPIDRARIARSVDALSRDLDDLRQAAS